MPREKIRGQILKDTSGLCPKSRKMEDWDWIF